MRLELPAQLNLETIPAFMRQVEGLFQQTPTTDLVLDFSAVQQLEMSGLGALLRVVEQCHAAQIGLHFENVHESFSPLLEFVNVQEMSQKKSQPPKSRGFVEKLGRNVIWYLKDFLNFLEFLGEITQELLKEFFLPHKIRWRETLYYIETTGLNAMPIVGLIAFLLGMIIAFQSSDQLRQFGANIFVVDLVALSMTRELAPLITSILIAGRSGSAFTAEIGTMKVSEEVDAMKVIGLNLTEYLIAPKVWALMVSLPLLAFWADLMGLLGGALIAHERLDIPYYSFITRIHDNLALRHVIIGLGKCVVFAAIISVVGCYRGLLVTSGAGSVGRQTTASVVMSIFLVIIADASFSVIFTILRV